MSSRFVWRELMTRDPEANKAFYSGLFGWTWRTHAIGNTRYHLADAPDGKEVAGMMALPTPEIPVHWGPYLSVPDVDAAVTIAVSNGGRLLMPAFDIDRVGRMAPLMDPLGATFSVYRSAHVEAPAAPPAPGHFIWETLSTPNMGAARAFYGAFTGWKITKTMQTAELWGDDETSVASVIPSPPDAHPHWMSYVVVENLSDAKLRTVALGGRVLVPSMPIRGFGNFSIISDPNGGVIAPYKPAEGGTSGRRS